MLDLSPLYEELNHTPSQDEIDGLQFIVDLCEGIEEGHIFPHMFYANGDKEGYMSHFAFSALGQVLMRLINKDPCYKKYLANLEREKVDDGRRAFLEYNIVQMMEDAKLNPIPEEIAEKKQKNAEIEDELKRKGKEKVVNEVGLPNGHPLVEVNGEERVMVCGLMMSVVGYRKKVARQEWRVRVPKPQPRSMITRAHLRVEKRLIYTFRPKRPLISDYNSEDEEEATTSAVNDSSLEMWVKPPHSVPQSTTMLNWFANSDPFTFLFNYDLTASICSILAK